MANKNKATIKCNVETCKHHSDDNLCELDSIKVSSIEESDEVTDYEETVCESYKCDKDKCSCETSEEDEIEYDEEEDE